VVIKIELADIHLDAPKKHKSPVRLLLQHSAGVQVGSGEVLSEGKTYADMCVEKRTRCSIDAGSGRVWHSRTKANHMQLACGTWQTQLAAYRYWPHPALGRLSGSTEISNNENNTRLEPCLVIRI
jgi:hypothetical protein